MVLFLILKKQTEIIIYTNTNNIQRIDKSVKSLTEFVVFYLDDQLKLT